MTPPPVDTDLLVAEIEATVAELNRLTGLATTLGVRVSAVLGVEATADGWSRPVLRVQLQAP